jgi:hypothetical protein
MCTQWCEVCQGRTTKWQQIKSARCGRKTPPFHQLTVRLGRTTTQVSTPTELARSTSVVLQTVGSNQCVPTVGFDSQKPRFRPPAGW